MRVIERQFGNDGYATWFKILEELGQRDNHYLDLRDDIDLLDLAGICLVEKERLIEIIKMLVSFGEFDKDLWSEYSILWNQEFRDSIADAYRKRSNNCIDKNELIEKLIEEGRIKKEVSAEETTPEEGFPAPETTPTPLKRPVSDTNNTQSKVEKSRVEKSREKEEKETHPAAQKILDQVREQSKQIPWAKTDQELFKIYEQKVIDDPGWWSGVKMYCKIEKLSRDEIEVSLKKWASYVIRKTPEILHSTQKLDASMQNWLLRENKPIDQPLKISM